MKISDTKPFLTAIAPLVKLAGKRTTLPVLNCLRIEASHACIGITATNLDVWQHVAIPWDDTGDTWLDPFCINAKRLYDVLREGKGTSAEMELDGSILKLRGVGGDRWNQRIPTMPAKEFPQQPDLSGTKIGLPLSDLADGIEAVEWAGRNESLLTDDQAYLRTVLVEAEPKMLVVAGFDGKMLACVRKPLICPTVTLQIPLVGVDTVVAALRQPEAVLTNGEKRMSITYKDGYVCAAHLLTQWPNIKRLHENDRTPLGSVDRDAFLAGMRRMTLLFPEKFGRVLCIFGEDGTLSLSSESGAESATDSIALTEPKPGKLAQDCVRLASILEHFSPGPMKLSTINTHLVMEQGDLLVSVAGLIDPSKIAK